MYAVARLLLLPAKPSAGTLAVLTFVAGAAGMVAGAVLVAAGLVSISLQRRPLLANEPPQPVESAATQESPLDVARWVAHFQANHENRSEPDWAAPVALSAEVIAPLVRSL